MIKPMLARSYTGDLPAGNWAWQIKYDGVRAIFSGGTLYSRTGNPFSAPKNWLDKLTQLELDLGSAIDGELVLTSHIRKPCVGDFQEVASIVRRKECNESLWENLTYVIFDIAHPGLSTDQRHWALNHYIARIPNFAKAVRTNWEYTAPLDEGNINRILQDVVKDGYEGIMLKNLDGDKYLQGKRSKDVLKVKPYHDSEFLVKGAVEGLGKYKGMLGALVCESPYGDFKVGSGFTDQERTVPAERWLGSLITVKYMGTTKSGIPRQPIFVSVRDYE
tara:strand:- start:1931 stop:2758 length:828 start_codon:yes stop_codon:yes gene_type:complete